MAKRQHPKGPCTNSECYRPYCQGYQLGYEEGYAAATAAAKQE